MPETPKTNSQQAQDAQTAANDAKATAAANKTAWQAEKERMKNWLKTNVGSGIDASLSNLKDVIISKAGSARGVAVDYLQKTFDHLYALTDDPTWQTNIADVVATQAHVDAVKNGLSEAENQDGSSGT